MSPTSAVDGVTAFPLPEIARYTAGLTGPAVPLPKIDAARQAILQHYRSAGYVLSTVSANLDAAGHLRFVVTEGRIASVKLDGDIGPGRRAGAALPEPAHRRCSRSISSTLERYLLLAQDVPGRDAARGAAASTDDPGALNLIAEVSRQAVSGLVSFDNRAFDQTGPIEGLGVLDFNSFTELGEKTEFTYYHTLPEQPEFRPARRGDVSSAAPA